MPPALTRRRHPSFCMKAAPSTLRERDIPFQTISGRPIERVYTPDSLPGFDYRRELNDPGGYPYTRGIHPTGYQGK